MFQFFRNLKAAITKAPPFQFSYDAVAVSKHELKLVVFWSAILAIILFLPYLYAYFSPPLGLYFLGAFGYVPDHDMHLAWSYQAAHGTFLCKNLFTSIPHEGAVFNLFLFIVGMLSRITDWSLDTCYQLCRFFISWSLGISVYYFVALFFQGKERFWGWLAALFAGGFDWILPWLNQLFHWGILANNLAWISIDGGNVNEAFVFISMLYVPLYGAALVSMLFTLRWSYIALASNSYRFALIAGILFLLVNFIHPYDEVIIATIICAATTLLTICYPKQWKQWISNLSIICLLGLPPIFYNYWELHTNPGLSMWVGQNICKSCAPIGFCIGLGLPGLFSILWFFRICNIKGLRLVTFVIFLACIILLISALKHCNFISTTTYQATIYLFSFLIFLFWHLQNFQKNRIEFSRFLFVTTWVLLFPALVYSPFTFQRRLSTGLSIPFAILFIDYIRLYILQHNILVKHKALIYSLFISILSINSLHFYSYAWGIATNRPTFKNANWPSSFVKKDKLQALSIIEKEHNTGSVLGTLKTCLIIPRYTGKQVVIGAGGQTENTEQTEAAVLHFYSGTMPTSERLAFLQEKHVAYIFYGPEEQIFDNNRSLPQWLAEHHWKPIHHPNDKIYEIFTRNNKKQKK